MKQTYLRCKRWCTYLLLFFSAIVLSLTVNAQITIDGFASDWSGAIESNSSYSHQEDCWDGTVPACLDNQFTQGSTDENFKAWSYSQVKNKNDIVNAAAVLVDDTLYFAGDRLAIEGDAQIGFWFFHNGTAAVIADGAKFGEFLPFRMVGDLLILADFTGGGKNANVTVLVVTAVNATSGAVTLTTISGITSAAVAENNSGAINLPSGWNYVTPQYPKNAFYEGQIDLGELNDALVEAGIVAEGGGDVNLCYSGFLLETRSSQSLTASLDDFVNGDFTTLPEPHDLEGFVSCNNEEGTLTGYVTMLGSETGVNYQLYDSNDIAVGSPMAGTGNDIVWSPLPEGEYYVMASNELNCMAGPFGPVQVKVYNLPTCGEISVVNSTNYANNTGEVHASASAGDGGTLSYSWTKDGEPYPAGDGLLNITGLSDGEYCLTVAEDHGDGNICYHTCCFTVLWLPSAPSCNISATDATCFGSSTGSIDITALTGVGDFEVSLVRDPAGDSVVVYSNTLSVGDLPVTVNNLPADFYVLNVIDIGNDVTDNTSQCDATITQPDELMCEITGSTNVSCYGESDGSATVEASGGTTPYSYLWSDGQTTATATGLAAGPYTVTITDAHNCTTECNVTITQPDELMCEITGSTNVSCYGESDGSATVEASGGTTPYSYLWSDGQTTATATGLAAGPYTVTITDAHNCTTECNVTITQPDELMCEITGSTNVSCYGESDGSATVEASGGTTPYSYLWSDGQTTATATGLAAGPYTVTITDAHNCTTECNVTITQPDELMCEITGSTNVSCYGESDGSATVEASGGTTPYSYLWSDGQTTATATGLAAGPYTVTITDAHNCTTECNVTITQPDELMCEITGSTNVSCYGESDGSATVEASGGTTPYSYLWSDGQTTATATGLAAGPYTVTITDAHNCTTECNVTITQPDELMCEITGSTNVSCYGESDGSATVEASGGTTPYSYLWSDGQTTATATGLAAGPYTVTITDAHNCTTECNVTITQPDELMCEITGSTNVSCYGESDGSATVEASGGTTPYSYLWSDGQTTATATGLAAGPYTVTITDAHNCTTECNVTITQPDELMCEITGSTNVSCYGESDGSATVEASGGTTPYSYLWSDGQTTATATGLAAGPYTVTITDAHNCTTECNVTITQPDELMCEITGSTNVSCYGESDGSATVEASGGTTPYSYLWSDGQTTATATGLAAGPYTVTITDAHNCTTECNVTITQPDELMCEITGSTNVSCYGESDGSATVEASGGTTPYSYLWSDGQTTATATGLAAGPYTVTITDAHNCTTECNVTITQPDELMCEITGSTNVSCYGESDGSATVEASGGTTPYSYLWSDGQTTATATGLAAGPYTVTITDAHNCTTECNVTITQPDELMCEITGSTNVSCYGESDGSATVEASGGTTPYSYLWSDGQTTATATGLAAGPYTVTITDAHNCTTECNVTITQPDELMCEITGSTNVSCYGESDGSATVEASGGTTPYSYLWSDGQTTATATGLAAGPYTVTITDAHNCTTECNVTITQPDELMCEITSSTNPLCNGSDGSATVVASGGTEPYSYSWDDLAAQTTATATGLMAGTYVVTITDAHGCTTTCDVTLTSTPCGSETAFAYFGGNGDVDESVCFINDPYYTGKGNRWGWRTEFPQQQQGAKAYQMELWMGAGQCDFSKGTHVGTVYVSYIGDEVIVTCEMFANYSLTSAHIYVGCDGQKYPMQKGKETVAPGQYNYNSPSLNYVSTLEVTFDVSANGGLPVNLIFHGMASEAPGSGDYSDSGTMTCGSDSKSAEIINPFAATSDLKVYPNPFSDKVTFEFTSGADAHAVLEINNILDRKLLLLMDQQIKGGVLNRVEYTPKDEVSGMYIYRLNLNGNIQIGKLIYKKE